MKLRRWITWAAAGGAALVLGGAVAARFYFGSARELEKWIGRQIVAIVNTFLVPQLAFDDLDYTAPASVSMKRVALTSADGVKVLEMNGFGIELAETPSLGKPVVIEKVSIDRGRINLIRDPKTGGLRGLSPFVKSSNVSAPIRTAGEAATEFRLSDVLRLRLVELDDIGIRYDPGGDRPAMQIDGITTKLRLDPGAAGSDAGWYRVDFTVDRGANLHLGVRGRVNLDTHVADVDEARIALRVGPDTLASLPSELQTILKQYQARGQLALRLSGRVPFADAAGARASLHLELKDFHLVVGPRQMAIASLTMDAAMADRKLELKSLAARLLSGEIAAQASVDLAATDMPATLRWTIKDLDLAQWRPDVQNADKSLRGRVSSSGTAQAALARLPGSLAGGGDVHLREARLVGVPLISALVDFMKVRLPAALTPNDKADVAFRLTEQGIRIERMDVITALIGARGDGLVRYDGTLDLRVNAGPLERVESLLGKAGDLLGQVTGKLVAYRVEGPAGDPKVRLMVLGEKLGR